VDGASAQFGLTPVYPALWLRDHPPRQSIDIRERTSWSCHHGVNRWMDACACTPNDGPWKTELRRALEGLAGTIDQIYLDALHPLVANPWGLRDRYIHVMLEQITVDALLGDMASRTPTSEELRRTHLLLEAQRERQRMFTSCGWFFEDFDRIEPRNNVAYAAQAVRLVKRATGIDLESQVMQALKWVVSPKSGLRADRVFQGHLRRTEGISEPPCGYAD